MAEKLVKRSGSDIIAARTGAALDAAARRFRAVHELAGGVAAISERDYIERALQFASWDGTDEVRLLELDLLLQVGCVPVDSQGEPRPVEAADPVLDTITRTGLRSARFYRDRLRNSLQHVVRMAQGDAAYRAALPKAKRAAASPIFTKIIKIGDLNLYGEMVALHRGIDQDGGGHRWLLFPVDTQLGTLKALELLTDTKGPHFRALRQCQLPECGGYFLLPANPGRGQPTKYHPECLRRERNKNRHK